MWRRNRKQCLFAKNDGKRSQNTVRLSELFVVLMKVGVVLGFLLAAYSSALS
jgi:F0F1-type ATP synthase assembly protein I